MSTPNEDNTPKAKTNMRKFFKSKNFFTFLFFVLIASAMWFVHATGEGEEKAPTAVVETKSEAKSATIVEKSLVVPLEKRGEPTGKKLIIFRKEVTVRVQVLADSYEDITADDFQALCTFPTKPEGKIPVEISCSEPFIEIIGCTPDSVDYLIENN